MCLEGLVKGTPASDGRHLKPQLLGQLPGARLRERFGFRVLVALRDVGAVRLREDALGDVALGAAGRDRHDRRRDDDPPDPGRGREPEDSVRAFDRRFHERSVRDLADGEGGRAVEHVRAPGARRGPPAVLEEIRAFDDLDGAEDRMRPQVGHGALVRRAAHRAPHTVAPGVEERERAVAGHEAGHPGDEDRRLLRHNLGCPHDGRIARPYPSSIQMFPQG